MTRFGWDFPPGCSARQIERSQGEDYPHGNYDDVWVITRRGRIVAWARSDAGSWAVLPNAVRRHSEGGYLCRECGVPVLSPQDHEDEVHQGVE